MPEYCQPHIERTGQKVEAARTVAGTPLCRSCLKGKPIHAAEAERVYPGEVRKVPMRLDIQPASLVVPVMILPAAKRTGRPRRRPLVIRECEECHVLFETRRLKQRFHARCVFGRFRGKTRKLPPREEVVRLYVQERLPTTEIARRYGVNATNVHACLTRAGVKLRRKTSVEKCREPGCRKPPQKIFHKGNGSWYGTLCEEHRYVHRARRRLDYSREKRKIPPERWEPWRVGQRKWKWKPEEGRDAADAAPAEPVAALGLPAVLDEKVPEQQ